MVGRTWIGKNIKKTSIGKQIPEGREKNVVGRTSVGKNLRRTSVGGNFGRMSVGKKSDGCRQDTVGRRQCRKDVSSKKMEERVQEVVGRTSVSGNLARTSVGGYIGRTSAGKNNRKDVGGRSLEGR